MKRTDPQNNAMHKYFDLVANALNDAGYDKKAVLEKKAIPVPNTPTSIKEDIWKAIQFAMFNKKSTTDLERLEVSEVYETMNRWLGEQFGIHVPFPEKDDAP